MRFRQYYLISGIVLFLIFIIFSYLVDINLFKQLDFDTTVKLQDNISRRFDDIFSWFSVFGMFEITIVVLLTLIIFRKKIFAGLITFFLFGFFHIIEIFGKAVVENIPPPEFLLRTKRLIEFPMFHVRSEYSYPSGHSGRTMFISVLVVLFLIHTNRLPRIIKLLLIGLVLGFDFLMLLSRIYLGEHWLTDVMGGSILGAAFAFIGGSLFYLNLHHKKAKLHNPKKVRSY